MLTAEIEEIHAQTVLDMLVSLWVTIRGFSFASAFIEMYKQEKKKGLQRSKALRKDIRPDFVVLFSLYDTMVKHFVSTLKCD